MRWGRFLPPRGAVWAAAALLVLLGVGFLAKALFSGASVPQHRPVTTVMKVVLPPPPPPPKPPPPPEPQPEKLLAQPKVTPQEAPKPQQAKPLPAKAPPNAVPRPPGDPLTARAAAGDNAYGLKAGEGGGDVIGGGGGGGGGGSQFGYFAGLLQSQVQAALQRDDKARAARYRLMVRLWLSTSGQITRAQLIGSSGNDSVDAAIQRALGGVSVGEAPPAGMPQPVNVRISAQG